MSEHEKNDFTERPEGIPGKYLFSQGAGAYKNPRKEGA